MSWYDFVSFSLMAIGLILIAASFWEIIYDLVLHSLPDRVVWNFDSLDIVCVFGRRNGSAYISFISGFTGHTYDTSAVFPKSYWESIYWGWVLTYNLFTSIIFHADITRPFILWGYQVRVCGIPRSVHQFLHMLKLRYRRSPEEVHINFAHVNYWELMIAGRHFFLTPGGVMILAGTAACERLLKNTNEIIHAPTLLADMALPEDQQMLPKGMYPMNYLYERRMHEII